MKTYVLTSFLIMSLPLFAQNVDVINPVKEIGVKNWSIVNDNVLSSDKIEIDFSSSLQNETVLKKDNKFNSEIQLLIN